MTRPRSDLGFALLGAVDQMGGAATWRAAAPLAGVSVQSPGELRLARTTWENMVRRGELLPCGREKEADSRVWRMLYERAPTPEAPPPAADDPARALAEVTKSWASFD